MHLPQRRPSVWKEGRDGGDRHGVTGTRKFGTRWEETLRQACVAPWAGDGQWEC